MKVETWTGVCLSSRPGQMTRVRSELEEIPRACAAAATSTAMASGRKETDPGVASGSGRSGAHLALGDPSNRGRERLAVGLGIGLTRHGETREDWVQPKNSPTADESSKAEFGNQEKETDQVLAALNSGLFVLDEAAS